MPTIQSPRDLPALPHHGVIVVYAYTAALDAAARAHCARLMTPEETVQHRRFVFARNRDEYLLTRGLARTVLAQLGGVAPAAFELRRNAYGRPEIAAPRSCAQLRFNLTNTEGLVACAVANAREVGVDAEWVARSGETVSVASEYFAEREIAQLRATLPAGQAARFFDFWTLKESYIKARGLGLQIPLDKFAFTLGGSEIRLACDPTLGDDGAKWWFAQLALASDHLLALCVERHQSTPAPVWCELQSLVDLPRS